MIRKDLKCIFPMIPKTGTQSIAEALGMIHIHIPVYAIFDKRSQSCSGQIKKHWEGGRGDINQFNYVEISEMKELWNSYYSFTFIRNPWDRVLSAYFYNIKMGHRNFARLNQRPSFKTWVSNQYGTQDPSPWPHHKVPTKYWICDLSGNQRVNFIGRFESLERDFAFIKNKLKLYDTELPLKNRTEHTDYKNYYDQESIDIIADYYKWDIKNLGYDF